MTQYIDKDVLLAEIEKKIKSINSCPFRTAELGSKKLEEGQLNAYNEILSHINTIGVKEVNLEEEIEKCLKQYHMLALGKKDFTGIAKQFFELGLKSQKEQTSECFNKDDFVKKVCEWLKGYAFVDDENKVHLPTLLHDFLKDSRTI